ncbi:MAG: hypothetical protein U1A78_19150 [Polyangia bacterium]
MLGDEDEICPICSRVISAESRSRWDRDKCRVREWNKNAIALARAYMNLPVAVLSTDVLEQLPLGDERRWFGYRHILRGRAPDGARGYRVGTIRGKGQRMRSFPSSAGRGLAVFNLEPFEVPVVPMRGRYVVAYFNGLGNLIAEPTFTIDIGFRDRDLRFTDGDLTLHPRPRDTRRVVIERRR